MLRARFREGANNFPLKSAKLFAFIVQQLNQASGLLAHSFHRLKNLIFMLLCWRDVAFSTQFYVLTYECIKEILYVTGALAYASVAVIYFHIIYFDILFL